MGFVLIQVPLLLAFAQVIVALPLDMRGHGLATPQIGWLLGLNGVLIVIAQPIALRVLRGLSHVTWLVGGAVFIGLGLGVNALAGGAVVYALASVLWTFGEIGFSTAAPTLVANMAPVAQRGVYQGAYQLAWGTAFTLAPTLGALVLSQAGPRALWLGCLVAALAAAGLHLGITARKR
jgi:MFS family permease